MSLCSGQSVSCIYITPPPLIIQCTKKSVLECMRVVGRPTWRASSLGFPKRPPLRPHECPLRVCVCNLRFYGRCSECHPAARATAWCCNGAPPPALPPFDVCAGLRCGPGVLTRPATPQIFSTAELAPLPGGTWVQAAGRKSAATLGLM